MTKVILIDKCEDCPYFILDFNSHWCPKTGKDIYKWWMRIPPFCPLQDLDNIVGQYYLKGE